MTNKTPSLASKNNNHHQHHHQHHEASLTVNNNEHMVRNDFYHRRDHHHHQPTPFSIDDILQTRTQNIESIDDRTSDKPTAGTNHHTNYTSLSPKTRTIYHQDPETCQGSSDSESNLQRNPIIKNTNATLPLSPRHSPSGTNVDTPSYSFTSYPDLSAVAPRQPTRHDMHSSSRETTAEICACPTLVNSYCKAMGLPIHHHQPYFVPTQGKDIIFIIMQFQSPYL